MGEATNGTSWNSPEFPFPADQIGKRIVLAVVKHTTIIPHMDARRTLVRASRLSRVREPQRGQRNECDDQAVLK